MAKTHFLYFIWAAFLIKVTKFLKNVPAVWDEQLRTSWQKIWRIGTAGWAVGLCERGRIEGWISAATTLHIRKLFVHDVWAISGSAHAQISVQALQLIVGVKLSLLIGGLGLASSFSHRILTIAFQDLLIGKSFEYKFFFW